jgi:hypothetical protein
MLAFTAGLAKSQEWKSPQERLALVEKTFGDPPNAIRMAKDARIWMDRAKRRVIVDGYVCLREGQLEMFACLVGSKEHESIVALFTKAQYVHAGLLAVGAKKGETTSFNPYRPASGSTIKIRALWYDERGQKKTAIAQSWIRFIGTDREMTYDWVFAGSGFHKDEETHQESYLAEGGDVICVANFPSATMDLAVRSDDSQNGLTFTAFTERIPKVGTPVRLVLEVSDDPPARDSHTPATKSKLPDFEKPAKLD